MAEQKRTMIAMQAVGLAEKFAIALGQEEITTGNKVITVNFHLVLTAPEGPSTGGGKQAVQHINLVPDKGPAIVVGSVNQVEKTVELRTYDYIGNLHAQRYKGETMPFPPTDYLPLFKKMQRFFAGEAGLRTMVLDLPPAGAVVQAGRAMNPMMIGGLVIGLLLALALVVLALKK
ncbi:MAG: hypothetical protein EXR72_22770 [Myxococcales bacterium]|nr:hypothetical protein [Myxococcales bacterium]